MAAAGKSTKKFDIQAVIEDWATNYFRRKATKKELKLFSQEQILWVVDWKKVTFIHDPAQYDPEPPKSGSGKPTNTVLFNTSFTNRTEHPQTYTFRTERSTRSSCSVQVDQGYVTGVEMNVKLTTPCQILEVNAGFKREMMLSHSEGETIEEELIWGVDSQIQVEGRHVGEAKLVIVEEEYDGRFVVKTHIGGRVRVVFTNAKDNNSFVKTVEGDVVDIVKQAIQKKEIDPVENGIVVEGRSIICQTIGRCRFKYGIKQMVEVDQTPISI